MSDDPSATRADAGAGPHARLRAVHPADLSWAPMLPHHSVLIGRLETDEVRLPLIHGTVSRRHFEVRWDPKTRCHLGRDLGSHNGSRVDGRDIAGDAVPMPDGTVVQLGDVCLVLERLPAGFTETPPVLHDPFPGLSPRAHALRRAMAEAATQAAPLLLAGDPGSGKARVAERIHQLSGRGGPLVTVDCGSLDPRRGHATLVGNASAQGLLRGADGGTLYLDEIGALPMTLQPTLLRLLQRGEVRPGGSPVGHPVDVRVIASTRMSLPRCVDAGRLERALADQFAPRVITVPPLDQCRGDLLIWLAQLHAEWLDANPDHDVDTLTLSADAAEAVLVFSWPQNLRQLSALVDELAATAHLPRPIPQSRLPNWLRSIDSLASDARVTAEVGPPAQLLANLQPPAPSRDELLEVFQRLGGNVLAVAKYFGRDHTLIHKWLRTHGLTDR